MALTLIAPGDSASVARDKINAGLAAIGAEAQARSDAIDGVGTRATAIEASVTALGDSLTKAYAAADAGIAQGLSDEVTRAETAEEDSEARVDARIDAEAKRATAEEKRLGARADTADAAIAALGKRADGVDAAIAALAQDTATLSGQVGVKADRLERLVGNAALASRDRVADNPFLFTTALAGLGPSCPPLPDGGVVGSAVGPVYQASGAQVVARRAALWLEPGRVHALRFGFGRLTAPSDPAGDSIRCGVACLDAAGGLISILVVGDFPQVDPASGLHFVRVRFPSQNGDAVSLQPPAGCVFWRPFIQAFGADGVTRWAMLADADVTDAGSYSPDVADLDARVGSVEAAVRALSPTAAGTANGLATLDATGTLQQLPVLKSAFFAAVEPLVPGALQLVDNAVAEGAPQAIVIADRNPYLRAGDAWLSFVEATLGLSDTQVAAVLAAIGTPAQRAGQALPNPVFDLDVTRSAVLDAARARFATIAGASLAAFQSGFVGTADAADGSFAAYWAAAEAPIGGTLYRLLRSYLMTASPGGPGLSQQQAVAQLTAVWTAAASLP